MKNSKIAIVGLGYVGLPTAAVFASRKQRVLGVDIDQSVVDVINAGKVHIVEPGLGVMVEEAVKSGFLRAVTSPKPADVFLIAVPFWKPCCLKQQAHSSRCRRQKNHWLLLLKQ